MNLQRIYIPINIILSSSVDSARTIFCISLSVVVSRINFMRHVSTKHILLFNTLEFFLLLLLIYSHTHARIHMRFVNDSKITIFHESILVEIMLVDSSVTSESVTEPWKMVYRIFECILKGRKVDDRL